MKFSNLQKFLWALVAIAVIGLSGAAFWQKRPDTNPMIYSPPALVADFSLTDHNGNLRTDEDFTGKWLLVFFGFTNCPDICPTSLSEIAVVMDDLQEKASAVQPLFITIDPKRDTPEVLAEYVTLFHPAILGLSGSLEQIEQTGKSFKIFYEKLQQDQAPDGYTMSHSSSLFLFDSNGHFVRSFAYGTQASKIVEDIKSRL